MDSNGGTWMAGDFQRKNGMNESNPSDAALAELLTLTVEVDSYGTTVYRNQRGQIHRILGPALTFSDGDAWWYRHDQLHRVDGPALVWSNGEFEWYLNGDRFSEEEFNERIKSV